MRIYVIFMGIIFAVIFLAVFIAETHLMSFVEKIIKCMGIWLIFAAIFIFCYLLSIFLVGKRYCMAFIMDDEKITTLDKWELPNKLRQINKRTSPSDDDFEDVSETYRMIQQTKFSDVNVLELNEKYDKISVCSPLTIQMVYVDKENLNKIWDNMCSKCPQATIKIHTEGKII